MKTLPKSSYWMKERRKTKTNNNNKKTTKKEKKKREELLLGRMARCIAHLKLAVPNSSGERQPSLHLQSPQEMCILSFLVATIIRAGYCPVPGFL